MLYRIMSISLTLLLLATSAWAYEDDIHYGLMNWLARVAGFSTKQSEVIARANVDYDQSGLSAIRLVRHSGCYF